MDNINFKRSTLLCLVLSILFIGIHVYNQVVLRNTLPTQLGYVHLEKNTDLVAYGVTNDEIKIPVHKGDSLLILGFRDSDTYHPAQLLVETADGQRGFISTIELGYPQLYRSNDLVDTISIISIKPASKDKKESPKVNIRLANGDTKEVGYGSLHAVLPDDIRNWEYNGKGNYYMSEKKFKRLYVGKSLQEAASLYRPYTTAVRTKDGLVVKFNTVEVFFKEEGRFANPVITYDSDLNYQSHEMTVFHGNNGFAMRWVPFIEPIIDFDPLATLIQGEFYENYIYGADFSLAGGNKPWWMWGLAGLYLLFAFFWLICTPMIPAVVMGAAMQCRYTFYHLNDNILEWCIRGITYIAIYLWFVLLITWGTLWWIALPLMCIVLWAPGIATKPLSTFPHNRCENCRRMWRNRFKENEILEDFTRWEMVSEKGNLLHQEHSSYKTWTETTYNDGHTTKSNEKTHHVTDSTYAVHNYNVLFLYHPYNEIYECAGCGHIEKIYKYTREELERKYMSSNTTTITTET